MTGRNDRSQTWWLGTGMILLAGAILFAGPLLAADEKQPEGAGAAAAPAGGQAPEEAAKDSEPLPQPERIEGKLTKVDAEGKLITVMVEPEKGSSNRAYRKFKLTFDDKSLVLIDQQPSTIDKLEEGVMVAVGYFPKGKDKVVDTVVVLKN